ncbi:hypothetical protein DFH06DRAFT_1136853 [Mycena polygramma]|nr:hypothetical protein DFH06DRAFT_1136853 [Mycena polygramma]
MDATRIPSCWTAEISADTGSWPPAERKLSPAFGTSVHHLNLTPGGYDGPAYGARAESVGGRWGKGKGRWTRMRGGVEGEVGTPCAFEAAKLIIVVSNALPPALVVLARPYPCAQHVFSAVALAVPHLLRRPGGEAFVEGYASSFPPPPAQLGALAAPSRTLLASALSGTYYRDACPPPVLPMRSSAFFRSSMPELPGYNRTTGAER